MGRFWRCALVVLTVGALAVPAAAGDDDSDVARVLGDRFCLNLVGGIVDLDTDVAAGTGAGIIIGLEDVLGFDEEISNFGISGFWRFTKNRRHALTFAYANYDRDADTEVSGTVPIFDVEYFGRVDSSFVNELFSLEYQYSLVNNGKTEAGISAGLATYKYDLTISGEAIIGDNPDDAEFRSENVGVIAPVPVVGMYINQALRKNLILQLSTSFINLEIGEHDGRIFNTVGSLTWFFSRHVGIGVGVAASDVFYQNNGDPALRVELRQSSFNAQLSAVF